MNKLSDKFTPQDIFKFAVLGVSLILLGYIIGYSSGFEACVELGVKQLKELGVELDIPMEIIKSYFG